ncbi:DUF5666 domain-containing protein [Vibrio breoganii]|uniref:DUF5666 domain-containing protein n=1 Tax=Vibrio breoganii TaxID=553239 RepID=UPI0021C41698|nr:DUF5666 domain-containing protein [Vibrio breoganii]MDN3715512.1 DUF5666 domain-containing protein [Vibrio breoganii]
MKITMAVCGLLSTFFLAGCGGSDGDSSGTSGSTTSYTARGMVESVSLENNQFEVNGRQIELGAEQLQYLDDSLSISLLTTGQMVEVVVLEDNLEAIYLLPINVGSVTSNTNGKLIVNGIEVEYDDSSISSDDWVMIFGYALPDLSWDITNVTSVSNASLAEIEGKITSLDTNSQSFVLGGINVDYSNAFVDGAAPALGMWVEVYGEFSNGIFVGSKVDPKDDEELKGLEIEGVVTWVSSSNTQFELSGGALINISSATQFDDGSIANLVVGALVEVTLSETSDTLDALEVDFESELDFDSSELEFSIEGEASYADGVATINGFDFIIDATTEFEDGISVNTLNGSWVELDGYSTQNQYWVKEVKLEDKDNEIDLEGRVTADMIWGYTASDTSLAQFEDQWVDISCDRSALNVLTQCQLDLD